MENYGSIKFPGLKPGNLIEPTSRFLPYFPMNPLLL